MVIAKDDAVSYLSEVGVRYRHLSEGEEPLDHETVYRVTWRNVPTGRNGESRVVVRGGPDDFRKLLAHWNRNPTLWVYA